MSVKYSSNLSKFLVKLDQDINLTYHRLGLVGVENIRGETPVKSGLLRDSNKYEIQEGVLYFINPVLYAIYQELGTYKMKANSFMRRGIIKSNSDFIRIIIEGLRV